MEQPRQLSETTRKALLRYQREEVTGQIMYQILADSEKNGENKQILHRIAEDEREHARVWGKYTGVTVKPNHVHIFFYTILNFFLGFTFVLKRMELDEQLTAHEYESLVNEIPEMATIIRQENAHEDQLQAMLDEERLQYVGAMVLGLNDALVELTGTIAGLTLALGNNRLVALAGIITGISATLSMAASNYLAERADGNDNAFKSSMYTGIAYLITVVCLVLPYLLFPEHMYLPALFTMLGVVILIIFFFNYYISIAKVLPFWRRFGEMACISLGVAVISFCIGLLAKHLLGVDVG